MKPAGFFKEGGKTKPRSPKKIQTGVNAAGENATRSKLLKKNKQPTQIPVTLTDIQMAVLHRGLEGLVEQLSMDSDPDFGKPWIQEEYNDISTVFDMISPFVSDMKGGTINLTPDQLKTLTSHMNDPEIAWEVKHYFDGKNVLDTMFKNALAKST